MNIYANEHLSEEFIQEVLMLGREHKPQKELAGVIGCHRQTLYRHLRGDGSRIPLDFFLNLCRAIGIDMERIYKEENKPKGHATPQEIQRMTGLLRAGDYDGAMVAIVEMKKAREG